MDVIIATGGTAGHIFPAIALARRLEERGAGVTFIGTRTGQEQELIPSAGFRLEHVDVEPIQNRISLAALRAPVVVGRAVRACRPIVRRADAVVGMGGYASVPAALAAASLKRPLIVHEQNAVPGLANRLCARVARAIGLSFAEAGSKFPGRIRKVVTGNPVRPQILAVSKDRGSLADEAIRSFGLEAGRKTVVVVGGSQGALHVDQVLVEVSRLLRARADLQFVVLAGSAHAAATAGLMEKGGQLLTVVLPSVERMELAYAVADLVVARAGATTIAELSVCGLPSILVPYPHATENHQEANARVLERQGAAQVILDRDLSAEWLSGKIVALISDDVERKAMADAASHWARPDADLLLADLVMTP